MSQVTAIIIFKCAWAILLCIAILAQFVFGGKLKKRAGILANLMVVTPYLIVFGWFSIKDYLGTYNGNFLTQILGVLLIVLGVGGYVVSIQYLRHNWAVSAAIKKGHTIIKEGPYKYVRHPMYFFMLLVILGSGLLISNYLIIVYTPIIGIIYYLRAKKEEELLREEFPEYSNYAKKTKMLIPGAF